MGTKSISNSCQLPEAITSKKLLVWNKQEKTLAVVVLAAVLIGSWLPGRIIISTSPSLAHRVFFLTHATNSIKNGDYLVFGLSDTNFIRKGLHPENDHLVKQVGCCHGDTLSTDNESNYFCGPKLLGTALKTDSTGRPLPHFDYSGPVPENSYFMVGENPRSFDSKYFGFIHAKDILYKAIPLW